MLRATAATLVLAAICVAAAHAASIGSKRVEERAARGNVSAVFSYEQLSDGALEPRTLHLTVTRNRAVVYDRDLDCGEECLPGRLAKSPSLRLVNVWGSAEPEVLVQLDRGFNDCCVETLILIHRPSGYVTMLHSWGRIDYRGRRWRRTYYFLSRDPAFSCRFDACAFAGEPAQAWAFDRAGRLRDVTRSRPDYVRADASSHWHEYLTERRGQFVVGVGAPLAGYCADEYLLGSAAKCTSVVDGAAAGGYLAKAGWKSAAAFLGHLRYFLRAHDYIR